MIDLQKKRDEIINILNRMIENCEPFTYDEFNKKIKEKSEGSLAKIEKEDDRIGIGLLNYKQPNEGNCTSTLAIIATITDIAVGERLAFIMASEDDDTIIGVKWFEKQ